MYKFLMASEEGVYVPAVMESAGTMGQAVLHLAFIISYICFSRRFVSTGSCFCYSRSLNFFVASKRMHFLCNREESLVLMDSPMHKLSGTVLSEAVICNPAR